MTYGEYECEVEVKYIGACGIVASSKEEAEKRIKAQPDYCLFGTIAEEEPTIEELEVRCWLVEPHE